MWAQNGVSESQLVNSLMQATENWLRLHQVNHPDFQFFASHGMYWNPEMTCSWIIFACHKTKLLSSMLKGWSNWDKMALDGGYMMWISCYARETEKCGQSHAKHYKKRKRKKEKGGWKRWKKKKKKFNAISGRHRAQERWGKEANKDEHIGMIYGGWAKKVMLLQADSAYKVSQAPFISETFYFMS